MSRWMVASVLVALCGGTCLAAPPESKSRPASLLGEEIAQVERDIAVRIMRRGDLAGDKRARLELEIDLRIILRVFLQLASDAKPETDQQAIAWLRAKQLHAALRGLEDAVAQEGLGMSPTQKDAMAQVHKLSFSATDLKKDARQDDFCRSLALAMVNVVNATPVDSKLVVTMRPKPIAAPPVENRDHPATVAELVEQMQKLAALSVPLRQQLMSLAQATTSATDQKESATLYNLLSQSVSLARGLQGNTAVTPEARTTIESQLAEGLALYSDPRTRDSGKARVDALGQYRAILGRIGRMGLSRDQMDQLSPALAWAQANPEAGGRFMAMIEQYINFCGQWDGLPAGAVPAPLKKPMDELVTQFSKQRAEFMRDASRVGTSGANLGEMEGHLDEMKRLLGVTEDLRAAGPSMDALNALKLKPVGALEKKVKIAADAAAVPTKSPTRNDADKYLNSLHTLTQLSQSLNARPLNDVPAGIATTWGGGKVSAFEAKWQAIIVDLANSLVTGALELDKAKVARLETALAMGDALRVAAQLDAALAKAPLLARWVDWSIDPATLNAVMSVYREALAGAFAGYATDNMESVDRWNRMLGRYFPLIMLITRDAAYADACQTMPIGFGADISRLATKLEGEPFGTERYTSYALSLWMIHEKTGDDDGADKVANGLSQRISRDLRLGVSGRAPRRGRN